MSWNYWNYRVLKRGDDFGVYEVYYDAAGIPHSMSKEPVPLAGYDLQELRNEIDLFVGALEKDVLDYETLRPLTDKSSG